MGAALRGSWWRRSERAPPPLPDPMLPALPPPCRPQGQLQPFCASIRNAYQSHLGFWLPGSPWNRGPHMLPCLRVCGCPGPLTTPPTPTAPKMLGTWWGRSLPSGPEAILKAARPPSAVPHLYPIVCWYVCEHSQEEEPSRVEAGNLSFMGLLGEQSSQDIKSALSVSCVGCACLCRQRCWVPSGGLGKISTLRGSR